MKKIYFLNFINIILCGDNFNDEQKKHSHSIIDNDTKSRESFSSFQKMPQKRENLLFRRDNSPGSGPTTNFVINGNSDCKNAHFSQNFECLEPTAQPNYSQNGGYPSNHHNIPDSNPQIPIERCSNTPFSTNANPHEPTSRHSNCNRIHFCFYIIWTFLKFLVKNLHQQE